VWRTRLEAGVAAVHAERADVAARRAYWAQEEGRYVHRTHPQQLQHTLTSDGQRPSRAGPGARPRSVRLPPVAAGRVGGRAGRLCVGHARAHTFSLPPYPPPPSTRATR
jgi:hypothetical protein